MNIHWKVERFDEDEERDALIALDCALRIQGRIEKDGETAGQLFVWYLTADKLDTPRAFMELWDLEGDTCSIYEDIMNPEHTRFREPLPKLLVEAPGILVVDFIALRPAFRGKGLGIDVMREIVRCCADERIGAVLLDAHPLQRRNGAYDEFDEEVRELPWNEVEEDRERLMQHFRGWGMQRLPRTRFMVAAADVLTQDRAAGWPPAPIPNDWPEDDDLPF